MDAAVVRAWLAAKQGLDGSLIGASAADVLVHSGWARSVGGSGPYLGLFARAGLSRETVDNAVADLAIHELPAARGCTYVVPAPDFAMALRAGQGRGEDAEIATAKKWFGVTDAEIHRLCQATLDALAAGPLDPKALKDALGDAVRNLGPDGKQRGLTTTLPLALGRLQTRGEIRRVPSNGRLDQQRYRYAAWPDCPLRTTAYSDEEVAYELARRFFRWISPATVAEFQAFAGLTVRAAKNAVAELGLVPLADGDERLLFPDERESLLAFTMPTEPAVSLTSGLDAFALLRRDVAALIDEKDDVARGVLLGDERAGARLTELPDHPIQDRGTLIGLWQYDPAAGEIVWRAFRPATRALLEAVTRTEAFVREQLGDVRAFSLDSPESRKPRIEALRRAA